MYINNWIIKNNKYGEIKNNKLIYYGNNENDSITTFKSNIPFNQGELKFNVKLENEYSEFFIKFKTNINEVSKNILIGYNKGFKIVLGNGRAQDSEVKLQENEYNKEIEIILKIEGSTIILLFKGIIVLKINHQLIDSKLEFLLKGKSKTTIYDIEVSNIMKKAFIIMEYSEEYNILYEQIIKPICENNNIVCIRADEINKSSFIVKDIIDNIKKSSLVIAELTPDNPNVFYEIGYSHALNKPIILLCKKGRELPFDLSGIRTILYKDTIVGKTDLEKKFNKYISNLYKEYF